MNDLPSAVAEDHQHKKNLDDSFGFDDDQSLPPVAPETTKHDPEKTVFCSNLSPFLMTFPDGQLLEDY